MELKKFLLLLSAITASLIFVVSCGVHPTTPSPSYSPSETSPVTSTPNYTPPKTHPIITLSSTPTPAYTPSGTIQEKLHEVAQAFGKDIPIPTYLPEGYEITDAQYIPKQQYASEYVELTFTGQSKPDIEMSITWYRGPFRILPTSDDYQAIDISGGPGTYSKWAMFNYHHDQNDLDWDWIPGTFPPSTLMPEYYEIILSASTEVPPEELVNIARFVTVP